MLSRWTFLIRNLFRRLWVMAALYSLLGVVTALSALALGPLIPPDVSTKIGADAVDRILGILASSMLAVTTFSIATMISAYGAAATGATPRATQLLIEDRTAQTALATFLGAFLFSIVSIIALATGAYGASGRLILFAVTIGVVVLIVVMLVRWIDKVSRLGRVTETIDQVERTALRAMRAHAKAPFLGAKPGAEQHAAGFPLYARDIGYVQYIDVSRLAGLARDGGCRIAVAVRPGAFVTPDRAIAFFEAEPSDEVAGATRNAFTIGDARSYDQDPRFGLIVLSEIASRALSPAVNDPGTAIDVIGTAVRVLSVLAKPHDAPDESDEDKVPMLVTVPPITAEELFDDVFTPIARDGAALVEVMIRLRKALHALARFHPDFSAPARQHMALALARAEEAMTLPQDIARLKTINEA